MPASNEFSDGMSAPHVNVHEAMKGAHLDVAITKPADPPIILPIDDIPADTKYSPGEIDARKKLAAVYRLVDYFKWTQIIYNHITVSFARIYQSRKRIKEPIILADRKFSKK